MTMLCSIIVGCSKNCKNGGRCVDGNKCECLPGWRGSRCHKPGRYSLITIAMRSGLYFL